MMKTTNKKWLIFSVTFMFLFFIGQFADILLLRVVAKPLVVLGFALALPKKYLFQKFVYVGFWFSALGDLLLELPYDLFVFGLLSFLVAHLFFIRAFWIRDKRFILLPLFVLMLYSLVFYFILFNYLDEMKMPVLLYMSVILFMVWRAYIQKDVDQYAKLILYGAIFFLLSDSLIGLTNFYFHFKGDKFLIMLFYWLGQFLIYKGTEMAKVK